jgi:hypothetical protein
MSVAGGDGGSMKISEMVKYLDGEIEGEEQLVGDLVKTNDLLRPDQQKMNELSIDIGREKISKLQAIRALLLKVEELGKRAKNVWLSTDGDVPIMGTPYQGADIITELRDLVEEQ